MIVTLTANPSLDRTVTLGEPLRPGAVHRADAVSSHPGGKGVNVSRVVAAAGRASVAVLPGAATDPLLIALGEAGIAHRSVAAPGPVRTNLTITDPSGTTTKINEPGPALPAESLAALAEQLCETARAASWAVLSGSLPPAVPQDWYVRLLLMLRTLPVRVAVDTSDGPLREIARHFGDAAPHLLKPNAEELAQLTGHDPAELENRTGDPIPAARAARALVDSGVGAVLATLGAAGAVLVDSEGAWFARSPAITPRSTVGAGDSALAGYLLADLAGAGPAERLRNAVAYGSAATALPGTALPGPQHIDPNAVPVTALMEIGN